MLVNFSFLIKVVSSCGAVLRKCKYFPIRFQSERNRNAILTISLGDMFGPSILHTTIRKSAEDSFNSPSLNLSLPSISSSLSI